MPTKTQQTRWKCPHCGTEGWYTPGSKSMHPLYDHDRKDGRKCRKAYKTVTLKKYM